MESDVFLKDEKCERCGGPILAEPHTRTHFIEESWDYVRETLWPCYACGYQNSLERVGVGK
jgi:hypothetical protein